MKTSTEKKKALSGVKPTGRVHIGNYFGAMRQFVEMQEEFQMHVFVVDYHAMTTVQDAEKLRDEVSNLILDYLAIGLDPEKTILFKQSDIPELTELTWMFNCLVTVPWLERAHAFKDRTAKGIEASVGLFDYPVLMAADILLPGTDVVPVGKDQIQHIEMARDIAGRFNHLLGEHFVLPEAVVGKEGSILKGLDGRKMSKSYNNTIPLFDTEKKLQKGINKIKTNLLEPGEAKDPDDSVVFDIYKAFSTPEQAAQMRQNFLDGIAWGEAKKELFTLVNGQLSDSREKYLELMANPAHVEDILQAGAAKARARAGAMISDLRNAVGLVNFK